MPDASATGTSVETSSDRHPEDDHELDELRHLLIGPEQTQLVQLRERVDHLRQAEGVSEVLPDAITLRTGQDDHLTEALMPTVQEAISISVKRDPKPLTDAIFPVIGPAIRKAVATALREALESFNQALERSVSWQSMLWRLEARRTGKSLAEVIMIHSLLYRVEQVFLIHKRTGLLLQHVAADTVAPKDADMVSGMLTAIQDFVHDSFSPQGYDELETLEVGELTVWIEQGPRAVIAGVIRGNAPVELRNVFRDALERIHLAQRAALESFDGDDAPFEASRPYLQACLQTQYQPKEKKISPLLLGLAALALVALGIWGFLTIRDHRRWNNYVERLRAEPGIAVTDASRSGGQFIVTGLRDPLAADPNALLRESKLDPDDVIGQWEPYQALEPDFIRLRAEKLLQPPPGVSLRVENGALIPVGTAPHRWIVEAQRLMWAVPGISQWRDDQLVDVERRELQSKQERIQSQMIQFVGGTTVLVPGQNETLNSLALGIRQLIEAAPAAEQDVHITIIGHADATGSDESNLKLSQQRADKILSWLVAKGVHAGSLKTQWVGASEPLRQEITEQDKAANRRVSFNIMLTDAVRR
jgi:OOP family OmpA-OmpF porin